MTPARRRRAGARMAHRVCGLRPLPVLPLMLVLAQACSTGDPPPPPANFSRPEDVAFACLRVGAISASPVPLSECPDPRLFPDSSLVLHALVTQTSTGEVAAVDMRANRTSIGTQPGRVIDSRDDIPGYTFVDVGAVPSDILVPPNHPQQTYVSSYAARTIGTFWTRAFRPDVGVRIDAPFGEPLELDVRPAEMVLSPDERFLYVSAPEDGVLLRIEICRDRSDCREGELLEPETLTLDVPVDVVELPAADGGVGDEPYVSDGVCETCSGGVCRDYTYAPAPAQPPPVLPAARAIDPELGARPRSLALDTSDCEDPQSEDCVPILLVGDANLPLIYRLRLGEAPEQLEPLATRVPVSDVAVTPMVRREPGSDAMTHYVYAIDATDGSVMVLEDGEVLTASESPLQRRDRLAFTGVLEGVRALSLEVVTPGYPSPDDSCVLTEPERDDPSTVRARVSRLRGVFLMVGATDGAIRVVDVLDLDMENRVAGDDPECRECPYFVKRHRPRIAAELTNLSRGVVAPEGELPAQYSVQTFVNGLSYLLPERTLAVRSDGTVRDPSLPFLDCVPCPQLGQTNAFPTTALEEEQLSGAGSGSGSGSAPEERDTAVTSLEDQDMAGDDGDAARDAGVDDPPADDPEPTAESDLDTCPEGSARVCAMGDPWVASQEAWRLALEGVIPGACGQRGRVVSSGGGEVTFAVADSACGAGVLAGDQLVITGVPDELTRDQIEDDRCLEFIRVMEDDADRRYLGFEILTARDDELIVDNDVVERFADLPRTLTELNRCFPPLGEGGDEVEASTALAYEVRALNAFTVTGTRVGFAHDVVEVDGECLDAAAMMSGSARVARARICDALPDETAAELDDPCVFNNGYIALRPGMADLSVLMRDEYPTQLVLTLLPPSDHLILDTQFFGGFTQRGVLPLSLDYSPTDLRLYMVDPQLRGLLPIRLDLFPPALDSIASHLN